MTDEDRERLVADLLRTVREVDREVGQAHHAVTVLAEKISEEQIFTLAAELRSSALFLNRMVDGLKAKAEAVDQPGQHKDTATDELVDLVGQAVRNLRKLEERLRRAAERLDRKGTAPGQQNPDLVELGQQMMIPAKVLRSLAQRLRLAAERLITATQPLP